MIDPKSFLAWLTEGGIENFVGVPDSLLKPLLTELNEATAVKNHVIAANEGAAVGYAVGSYLESGTPAAVYMQNSGLGNAINPLTALAHRDVYGTPMLLIVGWRGEPGKKDEPQHMVQGRITEDLLKTSGIPHEVISPDQVTARNQVKKLLSKMSANPEPMALVVPAKTFSDKGLSSDEEEMLPLTREESLALAVPNIPSGARIIVTTGMLGRELWELRQKTGSSSQNDFMVVGGMGHASAIAHGVADADPSRPVWCLDGDGSLLMHLGTAAVIGNHQPKNLKHVLFNNAAHDSVGGQPTAVSTISIKEMAMSLGYNWCGSASTAAGITTVSRNLCDSDGLAFAEFKIRRGARSNLGRPSIELFRRGTRFQSQRSKSP